MSKEFKQKLNKNKYKSNHSVDFFKEWFVKGVLLFQAQINGDTKTIDVLSKDLEI